MLSMLENRYSDMVAVLCSETKLRDKMEQLRSVRQVVVAVASSQ